MDQPANTTIQKRGMCHWLLALSAHKDFLLDRAKQYAHFTGCMVFASMAQLASTITPWQDTITTVCLHSPFPTHLSLHIRAAFKSPTPHLKVLPPKHPSLLIKSQNLRQWVLSGRVQIRKHQRVQPRKQSPSHRLYQFLLTRFIIHLSSSWGILNMYTP